MFFVVRSTVAPSTVVKGCSRGQLERSRITKSKGGWCEKFGCFSHFGAGVHCGLEEPSFWVWSWSPIASLCFISLLGLSSPLQSRSLFLSPPQLQGCLTAESCKFATTPSGALRSGVLTPLHHFDSRGRMVCSTALPATQASLLRPVVLLQFLCPLSQGRSRAGTTASGSGLIRGLASPSSAATSSGGHPPTLVHGDFQGGRTCLPGRSQLHGPFLAADRPAPVVRRLRGRSRAWGLGNSTVPLRGSPVLRLRGLRRRSLWTP